MSKKLKKISSHIETFKGLGVAEKMGQYAALLEDDFKTFTRALEKVTAHLSGIKESMESASVVLKRVGGISKFWKKSGKSHSTEEVLRLLSIWIMN